jgi:hypothetical protein
MIINELCLTWLIAQNQKFKSIFIDPPDNLGLEYDGYYDKLESNAYYNWIGDVIYHSLTRCDIFWISYYWAHDIKIKSLVCRYLESYFPDYEAKTFIWRYTFGQHNENDFGSGYRPILRVMKKGTKVYPPRVESERQKIGDLRASPQGRVPDDVWDYPRVCGTFGERRSWHPTQHPESLMHRIISFSCKSFIGVSREPKSLVIKAYQPDETFVDLCAGSGTSLIVGKKYGFNVIGIEQSKLYCQKIQGELDALV